MYKVLGCGLLLFAGFLFFSNANQQKVDWEAGIALKVNDYYSLQLRSFYAEIDTLERFVDWDKSEMEVKKQFLKTRNQFKKCEFLLCYLESDEARRINGANITTNAFHQMTPMEEKKPHGLQVIEDLIYNPSEVTQEELKEEIQLLKQLINQTLQWAKNEQLIYSKEFNVSVWDAIRLELFRIETMGITGFDVPESLNSIPESIDALTSLRNAVSFYEPLFNKKKEKKHFQVGIAHFNQAILYLQKETHFDSLNRLELMTDHLHPLSKWVTQSIGILDYTYPINVRPVNNESTYLYDPAFFNTAFFSPDATPEKVALGKKLFFDNRLSGDETRSCATCHQPDKAFADGIALNTAIHDRSLSLGRNTPTLYNAGVQTKFFYDSKVKRLEMQVLDVIHNPMEMGGNIHEIVQKLKADTAYVQLFQSTYQGNLDKTSVINALASFIHSLVSFNSRFDRYIRGERTLLTRDEVNGFNLFSGKAKCATCHFAPFFNGLLPPFYRDNESEIIGVPVNKNTPHLLSPDLGKFTVTGLELHRNSFKTVGLRNVEKTAPYMHNGVFETLEQVIDFYEKGGGVGHGIDLQTQTLPTGELKLTEKEKKELVAFLKSLTDESYR